MPNLDHLLGLSVEQLEALTDEQLLEHYKDVFKLEPVVPIKAAIEDSDDKESSTPRVARKSTKTNKPARREMILLKEDLLKEAESLKNL